MAIFSSCKENTKMVNYPTAKTVDSSDVFFGVTVNDPYRWMENEADPDLKTWIDEENALTNNYLSEIPFRQKIYDKLKSIYNYEKRTAPYRKGDKYFSYKNDGLQNQYVLYVQNSLEDEATILLDPNKLSDDGTVALASTAVSEDGNLLAYAIAKSGSDWNEVFVKDINSGEQLEDHLEWVKFSQISWYNNGFFYSRYDKPEEGKEFSTAT